MRWPPRSGSPGWLAGRGPGPFRYRSPDGVIGGQMGGGSLQAVAIEPRAEGPRLYQHHPDAEGGHLLGQGLGGPLQGGFGGG